MYNGPYRDEPNIAVTQSQDTSHVASINLERKVEVSISCLRRPIHENVRSEKHPCAWGDGYVSTTTPSSTSSLSNIIQGATGLVFVEKALDHPSKPHLTLLVRTPSKLRPDWLSNPRITIIEGSLTDTTAISKSMHGATSVVILLGAYITLTNFLTRSTATPIADALEEVVYPAMLTAGVKRLMVLSSVGGFAQPGDQLGWDKYWLFTHVAPKTVVPGGAAEMRRIGEVTAALGEVVEWTVFRIPHLNDGDAGGELRVEVARNVGAEFKGGLELSRASLVGWILQELEGKQWVHQSPVLGNPW